MKINLNLPFIWSADVVETGLNEIGRVRRPLLLYLKSLLDDYHGIERSAEYYDLLAGDWLEYFIHHVYAARLQVLAGDVPCSVPPMPPAIDLRHAQMRYSESAWHKHLRWAVTQCLNGTIRTDGYVVPASVQFTSGNRFRSYLGLLSKSLTASYPKVLLTAPYFKCRKRELINTLWNWRHWLVWDDLDYPIRINAIMNWKWRRERSFAAADSEDVAYLVKTLMPLYIPVVLLEGFKDYRKAVLGLPLVRPHVTYSANALHGHFTFKLLTAEWRQEGTLLLYHQHGGGYGLEHLQVHEEYETRVSDRFYSWGWQRNDRPVYPLSPAMLPTYKGYRRTRTLLICIDFPSVPYRLQLTPMPGTIEKMHNDTNDFLSALPDHRNLLVRPFPFDYGWGIIKKMRAMAPDVEFDRNQTTSFRRYAESRLVVHNYLGTSFLETLVLNIPTICFYAPDDYVFRKEAQPYIDSLVNVGIFQHSGKAAARFVAGVVNDPEGWWLQPHIQETRRNFVQRYANFSSSWMEQWEREFESALAHAC